MAAPKTKRQHIRFDDDGGAAEVAEVDTTVTTSTTAAKKAKTDEPAGTYAAVPPPSTKPSSRHMGQTPQLKRPTATASASRSPAVAIPSSSVSAPAPAPGQAPGNAEEKRKLIWAHKKQEATLGQKQSSNAWEQASFDGDDERRNKFLKLMGAKSPKTSEPSTAEPSASSARGADKDKKISADLEREFEAGRSRQFLGRTGLGSS